VYESAEKHKTGNEENKIFINIKGERG